MIVRKKQVTVLYFDWLRKVNITVNFATTLMKIVNKFLSLSQHFFLSVAEL